MKIIVHCYSGYRGEETPRRLIIGARSVEVEEVIDRWIAPDHRYFKLLGDDGVTYIVRHEVEEGEWEIAVYDQTSSRL